MSVGTGNKIQRCNYNAVLAEELKRWFYKDTFLSGAEDQRESIQQYVLRERRGNEPRIGRDRDHE